MAFLSALDISDMSDFFLALDMSDIMAFLLALEQRLPSVTKDVAGNKYDFESIGRTSSAQMIFPRENCYNGRFLDSWLSHSDRVTHCASVTHAPNPSDKQVH